MKSKAIMAHAVVKNGAHELGYIVEAVVADVVDGI